MAWSSVGVLAEYQEKLKNGKICCSIVSCNARSAATDALTEHSKKKGRQQRSAAATASGCQEDGRKAKNPINIHMKRNIMQTKDDVGAFGSVRLRNDAGEMKNCDRCEKWPLGWGEISFSCSDGE